MEPVPRGGELSLSFAQQRLWFLDQLEPKSPLYNIPAAVRLAGDLDVAALGAALDQLAPPAEAREARVREEAAREARRPFDLARGPLLRATLLRLADENHVALLTLHHIVADGWSLGVLVRELPPLYHP